MTLIVLSHIVNIAVAGFIGTLLFFNSSERIIRVYGENTPARQILACVYLAIAVMSLFALLYSEFMVSIAWVFFPMQIIYKLLTLISVKDKKNPVPWSNLAINLLHVFSLYSVYPQ